MFCSHDELEAGAHVIAVQTAIVENKREVQGRTQ
jgi:hypothetical protein